MHHNRKRECEEKKRKQKEDLKAARRNPESGGPEVGAANLEVVARGQRGKKPRRQPASSSLSFFLFASSWCVSRAVPQI